MLCTWAAEVMGFPVAQNAYLFAFSIHFCPSFNHLSHIFSDFCLLSAWSSIIYRSAMEGSRCARTCAWFVINLLYYPELVSASSCQVNYWYSSMRMKGKEMCLSNQMSHGSGHAASKIFRNIMAFQMWNDIDLDSWKIHFIQIIIKVYIVQ